MPKHIEWYGEGFKKFAKYNKHSVMSLRIPHFKWNTLEDWGEQVSKEVYENGLEEDGAVFYYAEVEDR